uniref:Uncharacterized protein n=1 Tax=Steinernema glaseri TaxID=37863 RepID=A0A1I8AUL4_9BILA
MFRLGKLQQPKAPWFSEKILSLQQKIIEARVNIDQKCPRMPRCMFRYRNVKGLMSCSAHGGAQGDTKAWERSTLKGRGGNRSSVPVLALSFNDSCWTLRLDSELKLGLEKLRGLNTT